MRLTTAREFVAAAAWIVVLPLNAACSLDMKQDWKVIYPQAPRP